MISETYHVSQNAVPSTSGSWVQTGAFGIIAGADMTITGMKVPIINYTNNDITAAVTYYVDGALVGSTSIELYNDRINEKVFYNADVTLSADVGSTIVICVHTGSAGSSSTYTGDYPGASVLGAPLSGRVSNIIPAVNDGRFGMECILDVTLVPIWTIDDQNDGYAYPTGTYPTEFTEFAKDADGYPLNWGVWKLDDQNDGYPWPTGYLPIHVAGGGIYKKINGILYPVLIYKKVNGVLYPVMVYKKVNGSLVPV